MENTVLFHAPSKTYNVAGLAAAFGVIPNHRLRADFKRASAGIMADINVFGYTGMLTAYKGCPEVEAWRSELISYVSGNMKLLRESVTKLDPLLRFRHRQEATYLAWLDSRLLEVELDQ